MLVFCPFWARYAPGGRAVGGLLRASKKCRVVGIGKRPIRVIQAVHNARLFGERVGYNIRKEKDVIPSLVREKSTIR